MLSVKPFLPLSRYNSFCSKKGLSSSVVTYQPDLPAVEFSCILQLWVKDGFGASVGSLKNASFISTEKSFHLAIKLMPLLKHCNVQCPGFPSGIRL